MPRKTKKDELAKRQDPAAPFLFDEQSLPLRADLVQAVKDGRHKHTGARLLDNDAEVLRLVELLMLGWGLKRIALEMRVSKHCVKAARDALVSRGEVAPYKERVVALFEQIVEVGSEKYLEALENGDVAAAQIPVGVGIISDKRALALGEPTSIGVSQVSQAQAEDLSVEKLNAWFKGLTPLEVVSTGDPVKPKEIGGSQGPDARLDATPEGGGGDREPGRERLDRPEGPGNLKPKDA